MKLIIIAYFLSAVVSGVARSVELCPVKATTYQLKDRVTTLSDCLVEQHELLITAEADAPIESLSFTDSVVLASTKIDISPIKPFALSFSGILFAPPPESHWAVHLRGVYPANSSITFTRCKFMMVVTADFTTSPYFSIRSSAELDQFSSFVVTSNLFNLSSTDDQTNADVRSVTIYGTSKVTDIHIIGNRVVCNAKSRDGVCELLGIYDGQFGSEIIVRNNTCENVGEGYGYGFYSEYDVPLLPDDRARGEAKVVDESTFSRIKWEHTKEGRLERMRNRNIGSLSASPSFEDRLHGRSTYVIEQNVFENFETSMYVNDGYAKTLSMRRNTIRNPKAGNQHIMNFYETSLPIHVNIEDNIITCVRRNQLTLNFPPLALGSSVRIDRNTLSTDVDLAQLPNAPFLISSYDHDLIGYLTLNKGSSFSLSHNNIVPAVGSSSTTAAVVDERLYFATIGYLVRDTASEEQITFCNNKLLGSVLDSDSSFEAALFRRRDAIPLLPASKCPRRPQGDGSPVRLH